MSIFLQCRCDMGHHYMKMESINISPMEDGVLLDVTYECPKCSKLIRLGISSEEVIMALIKEKFFNDK